MFQKKPRIVTIEKLNEKLLEYGEKSESLSELKNSMEVKQDQKIENNESTELSKSNEKFVPDIVFSGSSISSNVVKSSSEDKVCYDLPFVRGSHILWIQ